MTAYTIYRHLTEYGGWWAKQPRKVRWLAARYYAGIDTIRQIREYLTREQVIEIKRAR